MRKKCCLGERPAGQRQARWGKKHWTCLVNRRACRGDGVGTQLVTGVSVQCNTCRGKPQPSNAFSRLFLLGESLHVSYRTRSSTNSDRDYAYLISNIIIQKTEKIRAEDRGGMSLQNGSTCLQIYTALQSRSQHHRENLKCHQTLHHQRLIINDSQWIRDIWPCKLTARVWERLSADRNQ